MFVTLLVTVCLNLGVPGSCVTEPVVNSNQDQVTMTGCIGLEGFESAKEFCALSHLETKRLGLSDWQPRSA